MTPPDEVSRARKKLFEVLGNNTTKYLVLLRLWFQMKITREEFEVAARELFTTEQLHFHNTFIVALIAKCHRLSPHPRSVYGNAGRSGRRRNRHERIGFEPVDPFDLMPPTQQLPSHVAHEAVRLAAQERFLPDTSFIYSRAMLGAWEHGLQGVEDGAVKLILTGMMTMLRNVIMATICRRKPFHMVDNRFPYGINRPYVNRWISKLPEKPLKVNVAQGTPDESGPSTSHHRVNVPTHEEVEQNDIYDHACSSYEADDIGPITLYDLLETMQVHRNLIPSSSIMGLFQERIMNRLSHRSHEDLGAIRVLDRSTFQNFLPSNDL